MFCGIPAIVSSQGGVKLQVKDNENGFLIPELSSGVVANTIAKAYRLSEDKYAVLASNASKSNKEHSMQSIIKKLIKIYKND